MRSTSRSRVGFTLIEVMVAIAILGIAMTAIFVSEAGAIKVAHRARKVTVATLLARCKMGEIEEELAREGLPAIESHGTDGCCEGGELEGFTCDWIVERIELPDPELEGDALGEGEAEAEERPDTDLASTSSVEDILGGTAPTSGGDMLAEMAMSYAWPVLKPALEEQVRRIRVSVRWTEGNAGGGSGACEEHELQCFDVVLYISSEPPNVVEEDS